MAPVNSFPLEILAGGDRDKPSRKAIPPFAALRAFEAVGRLGGVRRAAQSLDLDHAVVSRHVRALETWSGVRLVDRLHVGGRLTAEGAEYHSRISRALADIASATADLTRSSRPAQLSIWCIPGFASKWLLTRLGGFREAHPGLDIEIHPTDVGPDFALREADADLRFVPIDKIGVTMFGARRVEMARPQVFPVASPRLLGKLPPIATVEDLLRLPLLHEASHDEWKTWFELNKVRIGRGPPGPKLWHAHLTIDASVRGEGIALVNPFLVEDELATGRLVEIKVGQPVVLGAYTFFCRKDCWELPAMLQFRRWLLRLTAATKSSG